MESTKNKYFNLKCSEGTHNIGKYSRKIIDSYVLISLRELMRIFWPSAKSQKGCQKKLRGHNLFFFKFPLVLPRSISICQNLVRGEKRFSNVVKNPQRGEKTGKNRAPKEGKYGLGQRCLDFLCEIPEGGKKQKKKISGPGSGKNSHRRRRKISGLFDFLPFFSRVYISPGRKCGVKHLWEGNSGRRWREVGGEKKWGSRTGGEKSKGGAPRLGRGKCFREKFPRNSLCFCLHKHMGNRFPSKA